MIKHNGKEQEKEYTCITASLPYSRNLHNMVNQIYFNKISRKRKVEETEDDQGLPRAGSGAGISCKWT